MTKQMEKKPLKQINDFYLSRLESVKTLKELYHIRAELVDEYEGFTGIYENIFICQNLNFWKSRIENRIEMLEKSGHHLDGIEKPKIAAK